MKRWQRTILVICCLLGMGISIVYHMGTNLEILGEIRAPVHVNIEIDKAYMSFVSINASFNNGDKLFPLSTEVGKELRTVVLYSEIYNERVSDIFIHNLSLHIPKEAAQEALNAIEAVSIFIGNKLFYFSHFDVVNLQGKEQGNSMLYELPGIEYRKSVMGSLLGLPPFVDWYGDFNIVVKTALAFFFHPGSFIFSWVFFICLLVLCSSNIKELYAVMRKQKGFIPEWLLLGLIVLVAFILRLNSYERYSLWDDEIYSAILGSNPSLPFMDTFKDPANPPLYYILLRLWFTLFGWTEQSGRFFSVLTGSAAIIPLYILVKRFANKKAAFLASLYVAVSAYFIGFSLDMRSYVLQAFLVTIVAIRFLVIIQKQELGFTNLVWYIIPSVLLVNTHYYGSLIIFANFLFYVVVSVMTKTFVWKKTVQFFTGSALIALSLLPYFIYTTLHGNPADKGWIPAIGLQLQSLPLICIAVLVPISGILYIYFRKTIFKKNLSVTYSFLLDYAIFTTSVVYLVAFGISLFWPILFQRYLFILSPLLIAFVAVLLMNVFTNNSKLIDGLCIGFAFFLLADGYNAELKTYGLASPHFYAYNPGLAYISRDAEAHPQNISVEKPLTWTDELFGNKQLPSYVPGDTYDVLYINPGSNSKENIYSVINGLGISSEKVMRIRINTWRSVFKIYP